MDKKFDLTRVRGEIIEKAINIEVGLNAIISQRYVGKLYHAFVLDVLYDEYFNIGFKIRIIEKVADFLKHDKQGRKPIESLRRLCVIRNYFAHTGSELIEISTNRAFTPDPRKVTQSVDYESLYKEFLKLEPEVLNYLYGKMFKELKINLYDEKGVEKA